MAAAKKTVKVPSIKESFKEEIVSEFRNDLTQIRRDFFDSNNYIIDRIEKVQSKELERQANKLDVVDWVMIAAYSAVAVTAIVLAVRNAKRLIV